MIRVYASGKSSVYGRKQNVYDRRFSAADKDRRYFKMMGSVIGVIAVFAVLAGFLLGRINSGQQSELDRELRIHSDLKQANDSLLAERKGMLQEERIAVNAAKLGLYPSPDNLARKL